jgi:glucokinase
MDACANGVLAGGARGGCVIAGGVAERLAEFLVEPDILARFDDHGPMTDYLAAVHVRLLTDPDAPLYGAAGLYADLSPSA